MSADDLKAEIERLKSDLDHVNHEKVQSAEYGLVLLEEKAALQQKYDCLESAYETANHELQCVRSVIFL